MPINEDKRGAEGGNKDESGDRMPIPGMDRVKQIIHRSEKMRITRAGLCFSGPTAYPSMPP